MPEFWSENCSDQRTVWCAKDARTVSRFSHVQLFVTLWTVAHQAPLSTGFSSQEYWSGCHSLLQGIFPTQGSHPCLLHVLHWQASSWTLAPLLLLLLLSCFSRVWLFATPWTAAYQAPPSMGFSRQEYWSGLPLPSPSTSGKPKVKHISILLPQNSTFRIHLRYMKP